MAEEALVLVVDDDLNLLKMVSRTLELEGYRVLTAGNGKQALLVIEKQNPDLVLLDIMMPGMDGFEVCERVRDFSNIPIVMLTAKGQIEDIRHGLDLGADDYMTKPFGADELLARVKAVLRRSDAPDTAP